ncbi:MULTISPECIES: GTP cyclohydrolase I FolE [Psychrobacter]|uniref:GTP cyclohydrolase 1 n=1 Tax=Psychrobacter halodurans TaxID=2818439 RepID=A0AAW4IZ53_9GAMM|nr:MULTISPECIES: GTP cyclohydrolase I FolE [Psychrobacter]MBO1517830.1 GTP cyclohydrolase I FolE [Psychrobacter halodurans]MDE0490904.1 GTP cyclohydrolase I FolE [Psychrobacter sp. A3]MDN5666526.1 GTP cyclohydrolase I FolE [Psychrobacter sp.]
MSNTPIITPDYKENIDSYRQLIDSTGEDLNRPGLLDTPARAAKAFSYLTQGYHQSLEEVVNDAVFPSTNRELVLVQNIEFYSLCEHHMLPFHGVAHIGYLPNGHVLGLSKFARIVDMFARRLQIQENLSEQVAQTIMDVTGCRGVAVVMDASHMCMMMRGVNKQQSTTRSTAMLGEYLHDNQARNEFLDAVPKRRPAF